MMTRVAYCTITLFFLLASCCTEDNTADFLYKKEQIKGETMGTTFSVAYWDSTGIDIMSDLETLLLEINNSVSTYIEDSEISRFNHGDSLFVKNGGHFFRNFILAKEIHKKTMGWFNPTVMPLVNYWGFGYSKKEIVIDIDSAIVKTLLELVEFDSIEMKVNGDHCLFVKHKPGVELDFSAIAKGDAVDAVGRLLEQVGIYNYFVEIGGEVRARGKTALGAYWRVGIRVPQENANGRDLQAAVQLPNLSLATSGNYENFYEDKTTKIKYAHTINPHTGFPEKNRLLSASVFAKNCAIADAFATAFMAMGVEKSYDLANQLPEIDAYFVFSDTNGIMQEKYTSKVKEMMNLGSSK
ncbi:FAD:protein FMN transferase [Aureispira]|nr:FAD:protein FMN transferase [Aureispira sp.]